MKNTGTADLLITDIASSGDFAQTNSCTAPLAVDGTCTITVTFTPTTRGDLTGSITILDNTTAGTHAISLSGKGIIRGECDVSPTTLDFGSQLKDAAGVAKTVTLSNVGDLDLTLNSIIATGDFSTTTECLTFSSTLAGGNSCTVAVKFAPTATGTREGMLTISHEGTGSPHVVTLTGTGTNFALKIPAGEDTKTVNPGETANYSLQLEPTGYSGNVTLACAWKGSQPNGTACSVAPSSVAVNGVDAMPFKVKISTTAHSTAGLPGPALPPAPKTEGGRLPVLLLLLIMLLALAASHGQLSTGMGTPARRWVPLASALLLVLFWTACGGTTPPVDPGTRAGTYTFNLSATSSGVTKVEVLTLKVN